MRLCELGGMAVGGHRYRRTVQQTRKPSVRRKSALGPLLPAPPLSTDNVVAEIRSVAESLGLKPGAAFTYAIYRRSGGLHTYKVIWTLGGWPKLSAAAGVPTLGQRP